MQQQFKVLSLSAGTFTDDQTGEKRDYSSLTYVDNDIAQVVENDRISIGQQHTKIKLDTANNNQLAQDLSKSGLIPGDITFTLKMTSVKNVPSLMITGFKA
jgi:hypothetical protein